MGALLGLMAIRTTSFKISGFVAISPAFAIKDKRLPLATYVDTAQQIYQYFAELKAKWPYISSSPEHPDVNYSSIPYHGLYELYQVIKEAKGDIDKLCEIPKLASA